jgi:hypothetical protein
MLSLIIISSSPEGSYLGHVVPDLPITLKDTESRRG